MISSEDSDHGKYNCGPTPKENYLHYYKGNVSIKFSWEKLNWKLIKRSKLTLSFPKRNFGKWLLKRFLTKILEETELARDMRMLERAEVSHIIFCYFLLLWRDKPANFNDNVLIRNCCVFVKRIIASLFTNLHVLYHCYVWEKITLKFK